MALLNQQFFTILEMDKDFAFELSKMLENSTLEILSEFEESLKKLDSEKCKKLMHTAKGSAANFGAEDLMNTFKLIESEIVNLEDKDIIIFKEKAAYLKELLNQTLKEVNSYK